MRLKLFTFVVLCCLCTLPTLVLADPCQTTNVSNLLGTSCTRQSIFRLAACRQ